MTGHGLTNSLNGHPSGKYSLKEMATTNNSSIHQTSTNESKHTPGSISGTSVPLNHNGGTLLTGQLIQGQAVNAATPTLSVRDKP